jgi:hypothetical protein
MPEAANGVNFGMEYKYNSNTNTFSDPVEVKRCAEKNDDKNVVIDCNNMRKLIDKFKELLEIHKVKKSVDSINLFEEVDRWYPKILEEYKTFMTYPAGKKYTDIIDDKGNIINQEKYYKMLKSSEFSGFKKVTFSSVDRYQAYLDAANINCIYERNPAEVKKIMIGKKMSLGGMKKTLVAVVTFKKNNVDIDKYVDLEKFCVIQTKTEICSN